MKIKKRFLSCMRTCACMMAISLIISAGSSAGADLLQIKERGILRHLGVVYANFVTGSGDGLDVELVKLFAQQR